MKNCIEGLEQYSYSYDEAAEQAADLRRLYTLAQSGESEFSHMASVIPRSVQQSPRQVVPNNGMYVDTRGF